MDFNKLKIDFDFKFYTSYYKDLSTMKRQPDKAWEHFKNHGYKEERLINEKQLKEIQNSEDPKEEIIEEEEEKERELNNIQDVKNISIITIFYNKSKTLNIIKNNIDIINSFEANYNCTFYLIDNLSDDDTYNLLIDISKNYKNVIVLKNNTNGCSSARNIGLQNINYNNTNYILFMDSDHMILDIKCINNLINNINNNIGYVGYYGGYINKKSDLICGDFIENNITLTIDNDTYLGSNFSLIKSDIVKNNNIEFDIFYDPFSVEDIDFSFMVKKFTAILKLNLNTKYLQHFCNSTTEKFEKKTIDNLLTRNSHYFCYKHNYIYDNIFTNNSYINDNNYNKLIKSSKIIDNLYDNIITDDFKNSVDNIGFDNLKSIILTTTLSIYPPSGGGENWLLSCCAILDNYYHICLCFKDTFNNFYFDKTNIIKYNENTFIIQSPLKFENIFYLHSKFNFKCINHEGHLRYEIAHISNVLNLPMISCFCFWNGMIDMSKCKNGEIMNINMINRKYLIDENYKYKYPAVNFFAPSKFVQEICYNNFEIKLEYIENISKLNYDKIKVNEGKYVSLLNCHCFKGGIELLYLLENLDITIPILGIITEKYNGFEEKIIEAFKIRNSKNNINKLYLNKVNNIEEIYNLSKIILIPSLVDETYCRVAYEAKILNKFVISYDSGNLKYIFDNYKKAFLIKNPLNKDITLYNEIKVNNETLEKWLTIVEVLYKFDTNETIEYDSINMDVKNTFAKINLMIDNTVMRTKNIKDTIGIYGPFCDQGLGIQMREYYLTLTKLGYNVVIYSHIPYIANIACREEWNGFNIFYSKFNRENLSFEEIIKYVSIYNIKSIIIPEICYNFIFRTIKYFKLCGVNIITPINIECLRADEGSYFSNIDTIISNNYLSHLLLKNVFKEKTKFLDFDNIYFNKSYSIYNNENNFFTFSCFGGLNSFIRKNIDIIYKTFLNLEKKGHNFILNIYIQGNINNNNNNKIIKNIISTNKINVVISNKPYKEIIECIKKTDIIIHFGDHEGLGLGFYEALNNNKPIITLNTFPNNQLIIHKINGFIIKCSFTNLTDNTEAITRRAIIDISDFNDILLYILNHKNKNEIIKIINTKKYITNNYNNNMIEILK